MRLWVTVKCLKHVSKHWIYTYFFLSAIPSPTSFHPSPCIHVLIHTPNQTWRNDVVELAWEEDDHLLDYNMTEEIEFGSRASLYVTTVLVPCSRTAGFANCLCLVRISCTVGPLQLNVLHPWGLPTMGQKYLEKKFQKVPKSKTWVCHTLATIYIVFTFIYIAFILY